MIAIAWGAGKSKKIPLYSAKVCVCVWGGFQYLLNVSARMVVWNISKLFWFLLFFCPEYWMFWVVLGGRASCGHSVKYSFCWIKRIIFLFLVVKTAFHGRVLKRVRLFCGGWFIMPFMTPLSSVAGGELGSKTPILFGFEGHKDGVLARISRKTILWPTESCWLNNEHVLWAHYVTGLRFLPHKLAAALCMGRKVWTEVSDILSYFSFCLIYLLFLFL